MQTFASKIEELAQRFRPKRKAKKPKKVKRVEKRAEYVDLVGRRIIIGVGILAIVGSSAKVGVKLGTDKR